MAIVSGRKCSNYEYKAVFSALDKCLEDIGGLSKYIKKGERVLIKPNIVAPMIKEKHATTHPLVVEVLYDMLKKIGAIPIIGESSGFMEIGDTAYNMSVAGYNNDKLKGVLHPFEEKGFEDIRLKKSKRLKNIQAARLLFEVDKIIFVPKLKSHMITKYTGAIKNCYGCVGLTTRRKGHTYSDYYALSECINDIYFYVNPDLCIMDAIVSMQGTGPTMGMPIKTGFLFASSDGIAMGKICSEMIGIKNLYLVEDAINRGKGGKNIKYVGDDLEFFCFDKPSLMTNFFYFKLPFIHRMIFRYTKIIPLIKEGNKNSKLASICPYGAISLNGINYKKCKLCFMCYYHYKKKGITKKQSLFARIASVITKKSRLSNRRMH